MERSDEIIKNIDSLEKNVLYRKMIEEVQDYAIILMDKEGIIINWNKGAQKIKQYTEAEILGKHFSVFYLKQDLDANLPQKLINQAIDTGRSVNEGWRKRKDGSTFWGSITITALHNDNQEVIGFCKVTRDLTDKKITDDNLRRSEERYHQMVAEVRDYAIILLSPEGVIENWNAGAEAIKGYTAKEIVGRKLEVFYTPQDKANGLPYKLLDEAKEKGRAMSEGWRVRKDGTKFWGTVVITALHGKEGSIIGFSKVTRDLTQQKIAEQKLAAYTAELEIQNSELEQFAYVASHDLQEPLRKIQTFTELIKDNIDDRDFVATYLNKLDSSALRMSHLVKSLLDYSRLSNNKESKESPIDLNKILKETKEDFELLITEKKAEIKSELLPAIYGNRMQIGQLFSNLIGNALKFSASNPILKISSKTVSKNNIDDAPTYLADGDYLELIFEDNGIGFEQEYSKSIFSLFKRLHGKQAYAGTGIGLALCKKIVENHKGHITARGEVGKGATFKVYFPNFKP